MSVKTYPDGREVCLDTKAGRAEYKNRTRLMWERQEGRSAISLESITLDMAYFDHQAGRGFSGSHRDDRIEIDGKWHNAALSWSDNAGKGSKRYEWRDGHYVPKQI